MLFIALNYYSAFIKIASFIKPSLCRTVSEICASVWSPGAKP